MSTKIKLKRGTNAAVLAYTADIGEPVLDTDNMQVRIGDGSTPGGILLSKSDSLYQVEKNAEQMRAIVPSGFLPPHQNAADAVGLVNTTTILYSATTSRSTGIPSLLTKANASVISDDSNKFYLHSAPQSVNVNGYKIVLETQPSKYCNNIIELPTAPSTGTRQDLLILEVWKEIVTPGASDDAFFPYGSVGYDPKNYESTYDSCTLVSDTESGGNWPLYLAGTYGNPSVDSSYHGKYVKANDANIATFIANPENNVGITDDGKFFQIRWRIATLSSHYATSGFTALYDGSDYFRPQGLKASRSAKGSNTHADGALYIQDGIDTSRSTVLDLGVFLGGTYTSTSAAMTVVSGLSLDGFTYNIPIALIHRRNSTAYSLANPNGAGSIASGISGRPDDKYYDEVNKDDILDLRHRVSPNGFDVKALHEETQQQLLKSDLTTNWENLNYDENGDQSYDESDIYGTKLLRSEGVMGEDVTNLTGSGSDIVSTILETNNSVPAKLDGLRNYFSDRPGEQVIYGVVNDTSDATENPNPQGFFDFGTPATGNMWSLSKAQLSVNIGDEGTYDTVHTLHPSVINDGGTYKMWYGGYNGSYRTIYCEGPDGINWSNHLLSISIGAEGTYDTTHSSHPSVILDGSIYKCWYSGYNGSNWRTIYCEGPDGINWSNHQLSIDYNIEGTYDTTHAYLPSVILDGSTYKCWYTGNDGSTYRIIYAEGPDGINWSSHQMIIDKDVEGTYDTSHAYAPSVILDGSTYKCWYSGNTNRIIYCEGTDGINWSNHQLVIDIGMEGTYDTTYVEAPSVILDGSTYKMWYGGYNGSNVRIIYNEACYGVRLDSRSLNAAGTRQDLETDRPTFSGRTPDIYWSDAVNNSSYDGKGCKADVNWWTDGSLNMIGDMLYGEVLEPTWTKFTINAASSLVAGDTYTVDAVVCTVKCWNTAKTTLWVTYAGATVVDTTGASTAHTGSGDASITVTAIVTGEGNLDMSGDAISGVTDLAGSYVGEGEDLHAGKSLLMNAYVEYNAGSGFLTRVPYDDHTTTYPDGRESIKACKFYIDGTQVLPNDGIDFQPFGTPIDPNNDDAGEPDTHCKSTGLMGFVKRGAVIDIGDEGTYDTSHAYQPSIIKDSGTYKMWYSGYNGSNWRIIYTEGPDGINWSSHTLSMNIGDEGTYDTSHADYPSVILDGSTYKCWYSGYNGSNWRIIYTEGPDGINWSSHTLSINIGAEGTYDTSHVFASSVILDGGTYKCWYVGNDGSNFRIIYCDSADGITWTNHQLVIDKGSEGTYDTTHAYNASVILDGSTYKCWYVGYDGSNERILYTTSTDGKNWAKPVLFMGIGIEGYQDDGTVQKLSIIKDDTAYKMWHTGFDGSNYRIFHTVLTMTDPANTGSSTTGVYSTTGNMNFAPGKDDSVLIQYEHRALQGDFSRLGGSDPSHTLTYTLKYLDDNAVLTNMGSTGNPDNYPSDYRDAVLTLYPTTVDADGESILLYSQPQYDEDDTLALKDTVEYVFTNNSYPKLGDYVSLASMDAVSIAGVKTYITDGAYNAFGLGDIGMARWSGGSASVIVSGVGEKNKELFMPTSFAIALSADGSPVVNNTVLYNIIGRPVTK